MVPSEENPDDSYEPPPSEQTKKKIPSAFPISRGEYAGTYGIGDYVKLITAYFSIPEVASSGLTCPFLKSLLLNVNQVFSFQRYDLLLQHETS